MNWQLVLILYFIISTASTLQRRLYAKQTKVSPALVSFVSHTLFVFPLGILYVLLSGENLEIPNITIILWSVLAAFLQAIFNVLSFKSQKEVDATQYTIIANIYTPITVIVSALLIHEGLTTLQYIGMAFLVIGAIVVSAKGFTTKTFRFDSYTLLATLSGVALGFALVAERSAIKLGGLAVYFLVGWGIQALIQFLIAWPERQQLKSLPGKEMKQIALMGILRFGQLFTFLVATKLAGNLALLSSLTTFKVVLVFVASFYILKEKDHLWRKVIGCILATVGLLLS